MIPMPRLPNAVLSAISCPELVEGKISALKDEVAEFNRKFDLVNISRTQTQTSSGGGTPRHNRTGCRPQFTDGERPIDFHQTALPMETMDISEFDANKEFLDIFSFNFNPITLQDPCRA